MHNGLILLTKSKNQNIPGENDKAAKMMKKYLTARLESRTMDPYPMKDTSFGIINQPVHATQHDPRHCIYLNNFYNVINLITNSY